MSDHISNEPAPRPVPSEPSPPPPAPTRSRGRWLIVCGLLVLAAGGAAGGWWWYQGKTAANGNLPAANKAGDEDLPKLPKLSDDLSPDKADVIRTNNRGVGYMEKYDFKKARPVFEEVVKKAPEWRPGWINLGIALLNISGKEPSAAKPARNIFEAVLKQRPEDLHAHFCLGILLMYQKDPKQAMNHFEAVLKKDPHDAYSWYWLGSLQPGGSPEQTKHYRKALDLDPNLIGAIYGLAMNLRATDLAKARALIERDAGLKQHDPWMDVTAIKYTDMGPYAEVIGRPPTPPPARTGPLPLFQRREGWQARLAEGARWAKPADFGKGEVADVRRLVRERFGATVVVLDYDRDGKPDLFLIGAVVEKGQVRNLLLRNDGEGRFTDVTAEAGLAGPHPTLGCCVADLDNDGYPDLLLTGAGSQRLFRNTTKGKFEDITARGPRDGKGETLDKLTAVCLGAMCVDLDQDSDLDLLLAEYAATPSDAVRRLKGQKGDTGGGLVAYLHVGSAPPARGSEKVAPLECRFRRLKGEAALDGGAAPAVGVAATDVDGDRDLDFVVLTERTAPAVVLNDRLLHFSRRGLPEKYAGAWNGALVLDADHDGRSDLVLVAAGKGPQLLLNRWNPSEKDATKWFADGAIKSPVLLQAVAADMDLDSWTDVVGLSDKRLPVLLHNLGGRLAEHPEALGSNRAWPKDLVGLTVLDANRDGLPDLLIWSETEGLQLYENKGKGNHGLAVDLTGRNAIAQAGNPMRSNADGVGAWVVGQAAELWAGQENTTLSAGLGQSRQPLVLGLAGFDKADVVRLRWPDGVVQAELNRPTGTVLRIVEDNRKETSCPVLFTWDGRRYRFVTDFLGAGSMGELGPDGTCRPPRPEESIKIEPEQLAPRDGQYVLKIAEPMSELTYLDRLQLVAIDHPADVRVYPDERFVTAGPLASQKLVAFRDEVFPVKARDHRGRDVTRTLRAWDRDTVDDFAKRAWIGFAEEHAVELDFGDRLAKYGPDDHLYLCLAGWTDYPYPESIWAADQAGVGMLPPVLERQDARGHWRKVADAGFPAGLPRMMLLDVTGKLTGPSCRLRLRTNLHVYWDQVFVAARCRVLGDGPHVRRLEVGSAELTPCGIMQEFSPDGKEPTLYDHDRYETVPLTRPAGKITRHGDVKELLLDRDDRFVIFGPGDELTVRFDARSLPPVPAGWKRSFVLRTWGYCKDTGPFTATGATVEPLPFAAMTRYPPGPGERYPDDALHRDYLRRFNTREVRPERFPQKPRR